MSIVEFTCFHCGNKVQISSEFGRREECPSCNNDVHSCKNCEFYDESSYNECKETQAEVVKEKERANYCDYFHLSTSDKHKTVVKDNVLSAAEALFKK
jgi:hypothetical protein